MEQQEQGGVETESIRLIAVEDLKQNQHTSFKTMLDLFYLQAYNPGREKEKIGQHQP